MGKGKLIVLQLLQNSMDKLRLCLETIAMNAGKQYETKMFTVFKKEMSYSIPEFVWLKVEDMWDYEAAVAYHASPDFLLNNLGEGSYGWMQRVSAEKGIVTLKGSAGKRVFVTVFAECALNHDPEKRDAGEIPDPSIVPDVTVICNAAFCLYVNGRKFEGLQTLPEKVQETVIKDVLLEKGMNRLFFEISAGDQDVVLGAVFRDKLGTFLTDTRYRLTLD